MSRFSDVSPPPASSGVVLDAALLAALTALALSPALMLLEFKNRLVTIQGQFQAKVGDPSSGSVVDRILNEMTADTLTLADVRDIHFARQELLDPTINVFDDLVRSGDYARAPDRQNALHKFDQQSGNVKWVSRDGHQEFVVRETVSGYEILRDTADAAKAAHSKNLGTYNFILFKDDGSLAEYAHFALDVMPWLLHGNTENDTTTVVERGAAFGDVSTWLATFFPEPNDPLRVETFPPGGPTSPGHVKGGDGKDNLIGSNGDDLLEGLVGADVLNGAAGDDTVTYGASPSGVAINLATGTGSGGHASKDADLETLTSIENVIGSNHADVLVGDAGENILMGLAGGDVLIGQGGGDLLDGGPGVDTAVIDGNFADFTTDATGVFLTRTATGEIDQLLGIEKLEFQDGVFNVTPSDDYLAITVDGVQYFVPKLAGPLSVSFLQDDFLIWDVNGKAVRPDDATTASLLKSVVGHAQLSEFSEGENGRPVAFMELLLGGVQDRTQALLDELEKDARIEFAKDLGAGLLLPGALLLFGPTAPALYALALTGLAASGTATIVSTSANKLNYVRQGLLAEYGMNLAEAGLSKLSGPEFETNGSTFDAADLEGALTRVDRAFGDFFAAHSYYKILRRFVSEVDDRATEGAPLTAVPGSTSVAVSSTLSPLFTEKLAAFVSAKSGLSIASKGTLNSVSTVAGGVGIVSSFASIWDTWVQAGADADAFDTFFNNLADAITSDRAQAFANPFASKFDEIYDVFAKEVGWHGTQERDVFTASADFTAPLNGEGGGDELTGNDLANVIRGEVGDDTLNGLGGRDELFGGDDVDTLDGGAGNDILWGGDGDDILKAGVGAPTDIDFLDGEADADTLIGSVGQDTLIIGHGDDTAQGHGGDDTYVLEDGWSGQNAILDADGGLLKLDLAPWSFDYARVGDDIVIQRADGSGDTVTLQGGATQDWKLTYRESGRTGLVELSQTGLASFAFGQAGDGEDLVSAAQPFTGDAADVPGSQGGTTFKETFSLLDFETLPLSASNTDQLIAARRITIDHATNPDGILKVLLSTPQGHIFAGHLDLYGPDGALVEPPRRASSYERDVDQSFRNLAEGDYVVAFRQFAGDPGPIDLWLKLAGEPFEGATPPDAPITTTGATTTAVSPFPSGTDFFIGGAVTITGDNTDQIFRTFFNSDASYTVHLDGRGGTDVLAISPVASGMSYSNSNNGFDFRTTGGVTMAVQNIERLAIQGGASNDSFSGLGQGDLLIGGGGADTLRGLGGSDRLFGQDGDDSVAGDWSDHVLSGGAGVDTLTISGQAPAGPIIWDLRTPITPTISTGVEIYGFEKFQVTTGNGDDRLAYKALAPTFTSSFNLAGGDDSFFASWNPALSDQRTTVFGGEGAGDDDLLVFDADGLATQLSFLAFSNSSNNHFNFTRPGVPNTFVRGFEFERVDVTGSDAAESFSAHNGDDVIRAGSGNDSLNGRGGRDILLGQAGDDAISGDANDLMLDGGAGNDALGLVIGGADAVLWDIDPNIQYTMPNGGSVQGFERYTLTTSAVADEISYRAIVPVFTSHFEMGAGDDRFFTGWNPALSDQRTTVRGGESAGDDDLLIFNADGLTTNLTHFTFSNSTSNHFRFTRPGVADNIVSGFEFERVDVTGSEAGESFAAFTGDDILRGGGGGDSLNGQGGRDILLGQDGDDAITGDRLDLELNGGAGSDHLSLNLNSSTAIQWAIDPNTPFIMPEGGSVVGFERYGVTTGSGDDHVIYRPLVENHQSIFVLGGGDDRFTTGWNPALAEQRTSVEGRANGVAGDLLVFDAGGLATNLNYITFSNADNNRFSFTRPGVANTALDARSFERVDVTTSDASESLIAADGDDILRAGGGNDSLNGRGGRDVLLGQAGDDGITGDRFDLELNGGAGNDHLSLNLLTSTAIQWAIDPDVGFIMPEGGRILGFERYGLTTGTGDDHLIFRPLVESHQSIFALGGGDDRFTTGWNPALTEQRISVQGDAHGPEGDLLVFDAGGLATNLGYFTFSNPANNRFSFTRPGETNNSIDARTFERVHVKASDANESLTGGDRDDILAGLGGNDSLNGRNGDDVIDGGAGDDGMTGGGGADTFVIRPGDGVDRIADFNIGAGDRVLAFGFTAAPAISDEGNDLLLDFGGGQTVRLSGRAGESLPASAVVIEGNEFSRATVGDDRLTGTALADQLQAGDGADIVDGGAGDDQISGEDGSDILQGGAGDDILDGGPGNDIFIGGPGADHYVGGPGDDVFRMQDRSDSIADSDGTDRVRADFSFVLPAGIEELALTELAIDGNGFGNAAANRLFGNDGANTLRGYGADDVIAGGAGGDILRGDDGADRLLGDAGDDRLIGGAGPDHMEGGLGDDIYSVDDIGDVVIERSGEGAFDRINVFADFTNPANVEFLIGKFASVGLNLTGNGQTNRITGSGKISFGDTLLGEGGNDRLVGLSGNDQIEGGDGRDRIFGNSGDDVLVGGAGFDRLTGQFGADVFVHNPGDGVDRITDFNTAFDVLGLRGHGFASFAEVAAQLVQRTNDVLLDLSGPEGLIFEGHTLASLSLGAEDVLI